MKFRRILKEFIIAFLSTLAVSGVLWLGDVIIPYIKYELLFSVIIALSLIGTVKKCRSYTIHFRWWYKYRKNAHTLEIYPRNEIRHIEKIYPEKLKKSFDGKICSEFLWDDVNVKSIDFVSRDNDNVKFTVIDSSGKQSIYMDTHVDFQNDDVDHIKYAVEFPFNKCHDMSFKTKMSYDNDTKPEYFVDVERPIKELIISIKVFGNVKIKNVKKKVVPLYGECDPNSKNINGVAIESEDEINCKVYNFRIKEPLLLHRYMICWDWM